MPFLTKALIALLAMSGLAPTRAETYATTSRVSIDRCASAWFIKRFVDADAKFVFFEQGAKPPTGIGYGFLGAAYFNHGQDCTFTDLVKKQRKTPSAALQQMNKVVNDVMSWMQGPGSLSAHFNQHIADVRELVKSDGEVYEALFPTFDLLYVKLGGPRNDFLESQRGHVDYLELSILQRFVNEKGRIKITQLVAYAGKSGAGSDSELLNLVGARQMGSKADSASQDAEADPGGLVNALDGKTDVIGAKEFNWLRVVLQENVQEAQLGKLLSWGSTNSAALKADSLLTCFEKELWSGTRVQ